MAKNRRLRGSGNLFKRGGIWYARWTISATDRPVRSCGTSDKATAQRMLHSWTEDQIMRDKGLIDVAAEHRAEQATLPITDHAEAFCQFVEGKGRDAKHVGNLRLAIFRIIEHAHFTSLEHVSPSRVQAVIKMFMSGNTITVGGIGNQTATHYLRAIKSFTKWAVGDGRMPADPIAHLSGWNAATDRRRERRALSGDEVARLLAVADASPDVTVERRKRVDSKSVMFTSTTHVPDRGMVYRLALMTGLRAGELAALTPQSFNLRGDEPTVTVEAVDSKRRRSDVQPLHATMAAMLKLWLKGKPKDERVFQIDLGKAASWLRADLDTARAQWLDEAQTTAEREVREQSDFLCHTDGAHRVADLHACRHTFITNVVQNASTIKVAMTLARHSDPKLTLGRYTHVRLADVRGALPDLPKPESIAYPALMRATGTDDASPMRKAIPSPKDEKACSLICIPISCESSQSPTLGGMHPMSMAQGDRTSKASSDGVLRIPVQRFATGAEKPATGLEPVTCSLQNCCSTS